MRKLALILITGIAFSACNQSKKPTDWPISYNQIVIDSLTAELDSIQKNGQINGFTKLVLTFS